MAAHSYTTAHVRRCLELYEQGYGYRRVSFLMRMEFKPGPGPDWVREQVQRAGKARSKPRAQQLRRAIDAGQPDPKVMEAIAKAKAALGYTAARIAKELGVDPSWLRLRGIATGRDRRTTEINEALFPRAPEQAEKSKQTLRILELRAKGLGVVEIARRLNLCRHLVGNRLRFATAAAESNSSAA